MFQLATPCSSDQKDTDIAEFLNALGFTTIILGLFFCMMWAKGSILNQVIATNMPGKVSVIGFFFSLAVLASFIYVADRNIYYVFLFGCSFAVGSYILKFK